MEKTWVDELFVSGLYRRIWTIDGGLDIGSDRSSREVDDILALLEPPAGAHILDWCGGYGRHAIELARRHFRVTLLDYAPNHLDEAREYAQEHDISLTCVQADFRDTPQDIQADCAINIFTSGLGYFGEEEDDKALWSLRGALKSKARLIIETMNLHWLARNFQTRGWRVSADGTLHHLEERSFDFTTDMLDCRNLIFGPDDQRYEFRTNHLVYSPERLCRVLDSAGFRPIRLFGGLDQSDLDFKSPRLLIVAEKKN